MKKWRTTMSKRQPPLLPPEVPEELCKADKDALWRWTREHHPHLTGAQVKGLMLECLLHFDSVGNPKGYTRWLAVVKLWIQRDQKWANQRMEARPELPQEQGPRGSDLAPIIDLAQRRKA